MVGYITPTTPPPPTKKKYSSRRYTQFAPLIVPVDIIYEDNTTVGRFLAELCVVCCLGACLLVVGVIIV
jgi:hypothetical protein